VTIDELPPTIPPDLQTSVPTVVWNRLTRQYRGVFDLPMLRRHVQDHLGLEVAEDLVGHVREFAPGSRTVLDIGCGFGSFVWAATAAGMRATGLELASVEVEFAVDRHRSTYDGAPFAVGDGSRLPFPAHAFDAVTLWNVLEHVPDVQATLAEAARVLKHDGALFIEAPNYAAARLEAHYHVPWLPFLRGRLAERWLQLLGRDATFWRDEVHPCTQRDVVRRLHGLGFTVTGMTVARLDPARPPRSRARRALITSLRRSRLLPLLASALAWHERNPFKGSIRVVARRS
jgi:MPBQ/MSBQ methyltransferase